MENEAYLENGFDPNSLKVAELRGILLKHDVDYPSSAKKSILVDLFNANVATKATKLRASRARVSASDEGMINAGFTPEKNEIGATPRRVRRTTRGATEDANEEEEANAGARRSTRTPSRKRVDNDVQDEIDMPPPPSTVRKTRKSIARFPVDDVVTPGRQIAAEDPDTPFSSHNPFQKGTPSPAKSPDPERRRTTLDTQSICTKKPFTSLRRRTDGVPAADIQVYEQFDHPIEARVVTDALRKRRQSSRPRQSTNGGAVVKQERFESPPMMDSMEPGEEFVPQEAMELAQEPELQLARRRRQRSQGSGTSGSVVLAIVSFAMLAYAVWWRAEKLEVGYCGVGGLDMRKQQPSNAFVELIRPACEPCPPHARCYPGMELDCVDDYIKANSYLALGGLWPIPPACVPDSEKERRVMIMSDAALDVLRRSGAEQRCKEKFLSGGIELEGVSEGELRQVLYNRKATSLSDREFSELWRHALEDVSNREEVIVETDTDSGTTKLKSTSIAALPFGCAARLFIAGSVARHRVEIIGVIVLLITGVALRQKMASRKVYNTKVTKLVHIALSQLAVNAIQHPDYPYIAVAHLRDQVLQHEFNPHARKHLWSGVERVVEQNSNVRAGEREVQGEIMRVWTWIGGQFVEGKNVFGDDATSSAVALETEWRRGSRPVV